MGGFGTLVREHRVAAGLSQEQLAERAGLSAEAVSAIERGVRRSPYRDTVARLADALELTGPDRMRFIATVSRSRSARPAVALAPAESLVGRDGVLAEVCRLLAGGTRLLSIVGPGGVGKTRVALAAADRVSAEFGGAVNVALLAPVSDGPGVIAAVADAFGVPGDTVPHALPAHVVRGRRLLVLDNVEHVLEAAPIVAALLDGAPDLTILATSRARLRISSERVVDLAPLELESACALFAQRAREARPDLPSGENFGRIAEAICSRLDGLPLAIELAAARLRHWTPETLLERLDDPLEALAAGSVDLPARQRAMREALAWSYAQLDPPDAHAFRAISMFADGWDLDGAAAVLGGKREASDRLASLVDKSLVRLQYRRDEARFGLLETMREYACERISEQPAEYRDAADAFADHYRGVAEEAGRRFRRGEGDRAFRTLVRERENIRAAVRWYRSQGDALSVLRIAAATWHYEERAGNLREGLASLHAALEAVSIPDAPAQLVARAANGAAVLAVRCGAFGDVERYAAIALTAAAEAGDAENLAAVHTVLGGVASKNGDAASARAAFREALELRRPLSNPRSIATSLNNLAYAERNAGSYDEAAKLFAESIALYREVGERYLLAGTLTNLAITEGFRGNVARARALVAESLENFGERDAMGIADAIFALAPIALAAGDATRAASYLGAAASLRAAMGHGSDPIERRNAMAVQHTIREALGHAEFAKAYEAGSAMSLAQALADARTFAAGDQA